MAKALIHILSYNKRALLLKAVTSVRRFAPPEWELLVVDNHSSDGSVEALSSAFPDIHLLSNSENLGAVGGRNAGYRYARQHFDFDYVLFLDEDAEVSASALEELLRVMESDSATAIACGKTYTSFAGKTIMSAGARCNWWLGLCQDIGAGQEDKGQFDHSGYVDACGAFAFLIRCSVFDALEGFDPAFSPYGFEDFDLCLRARKLGYRTHYSHAALFCHKGTRQGRKPIKAYEQAKIRNYLLLLSRNASALQKLSCLFIVPIRGLLLMGRFVLRGHWSVIPSQIRGLMAFLGGRDSQR